MRKTIKKLAVLLLALMLVFTLVACSSGLSGTYVSEEGGISQSVTFSGNKITMSALGLDINGTYTISDGKITITYSVLGVETSDTQTFSQSGNTVTIGGQEFVKK